MMYELSPKFFPSDHKSKLGVILFHFIPIRWHTLEESLAYHMDFLLFVPNIYQVPGSAKSDWSKY